MFDQWSAETWCASTGITGRRVSNTKSLWATILERRVSNTESLWATILECQEASGSNRRVVVWINWVGRFLIFATLASALPLHLPIMSRSSPFQTSLPKLTSETYQLLSHFQVANGAHTFSRVSVLMCRDVSVCLLMNLSCMHTYLVCMCVSVCGCVCDCMHQCMRTCVHVRPCISVCVCPCV